MAKDDVILIDSAAHNPASVIQASIEWMMDKGFDEDSVRLFLECMGNAERTRQEMINGIFAAGKAYRSGWAEYDL